VLNDLVPVVGRAAAMVAGARVRLASADGNSAEVGVFQTKGEDGPSHGTQGRDGSEIPCRPDEVIE
jgi:hypothetical protein